MASYYFFASHLLNDEVDYELKLRNYGEECSKSIDSKRRTLRRLVNQDKQENRDYRSMYSIDQEFDLISSRVNAIAGALSQNVDAKLISRLGHYHSRALRSNAHSTEAKAMKDSLVKQISDLVALYRPKSPMIPSGGHEESSQEEDIDHEKAQNKLTGSEGQNDGSKLGLEIRKGKEIHNESGTNVGQSNLELKVHNLEAQMTEIMSMLQQVLAKQQQNGQGQKEPEATVQVNRTGAIPKTSATQMSNSGLQASPLEESRNRLHLGDNFVRNLGESRQNTAGTRLGQSHNQFMGECYQGTNSLQHQGFPTQAPIRDGLPRAGFRTVNPPISPQYGVQGEQSMGNTFVGQTRFFPGYGTWNENHRNEPFGSPSGSENFQRDCRMQYDRRIEKWNIYFSGVPRSPTLEDFIYKVKVLASMNGIPRDILISHIHLLLRDEASNWFFTYYEANWNWDEFETRIRYRFGNPNQDQGNRQQIYERKQLKGETFIAFVTEIERLSKLLTNPLPAQRKFEIIWENMRQHYRSKLACFQINNLDQLIQMNYRIDASDPSLHPVGQKQGVNNIEVDSEGEPSEDEEINELSRQYQRGQGVPRHQDGTRERTNEAARVPLCWNCRKNGHFWRECREAKTTFCYVCGNPGRISTTCESHPKRDSARGVAGSQNSGN